MAELKGHVGKPSKSKDLEKILVPGNWCVIKSITVNGRTRSPSHQIFRIGEKGLIRNDENLAIDVQPYKNPHMGVDERLVLKTNNYQNLIQELDEVSLKRGGVHTRYYFNEFTFSNAPGEYIPHDSGEYIDEINVDQKKVNKEFKNYIEELELRLNSIPFVLPDHYLHVGIYGSHQVPDFFENAANEMLKYLIKIGHTDKIPSHEEVKRAEEAFQLHRDKDGKDPTRRKYMKRFYEIREKRTLLWKEYGEIRSNLSELLKKSSQVNMTISAISSAIQNHSNFGTNGDYVWFSETNQDIVKNDKGEYQSIPRRNFKLFPSKLSSNVMYAVPQNENSRDYVLSILDNFNEKYPDTQHIPEAKQNTKLPISYLEKKRRIHT